MTLIQYFKVYREAKLAYGLLSHLIPNLYTKIVKRYSKGTPPAEMGGALILT